MAPLSCIELTGTEQARLLAIARQSIAHGLTAGRPLAIAASECTGALAQRLGSFVTLTRNEQLRGCVGAIASDSPLAEGVADSAFKAAFSDPRFPALRVSEFERVLIEVSILSAPEPVRAGDEATLLGELRPQVDGLILIEGRRQATFLPKVWEKLGEPDAFLRALKLKAGLPDDHWSDTIRFLRYRTTSIAENDMTTPALT